MSNSPSPVQHGYMVLADISGYNSFLTQTELDHAQEFLTDLLDTILKRLRSLLTIHKIEDDAIFACAPASKLVRGATLLELIETTYTRFPRTHEERPPAHHLHLPGLSIPPRARLQVHGPSRGFCGPAHRREANNMATSPFYRPRHIIYTSEGNIFIVTNLNGSSCSGVE